MPEHELCSYAGLPVTLATSHDSVGQIIHGLDVAVGAFFLKKKKKKTCQQLVVIVRIIFKAGGHAAELS